MEYNGSAFVLSTPLGSAIPAYLRYLRSQFTTGIKCKCGEVLPLRRMWSTVDEAQSEIIAAGGSTPLLPSIKCNRCNASTCAACGDNCDNADSTLDAAHAAACPLRYHYATALVVESLRQTELRVGMGQKQATIAGAGKPKVKKNSEKSRAKGKKKSQKYPILPSLHDSPTALPPVPAPPPVPKVIAQAAWSCPVCTFFNEAGTTMCGACNGNFKEEYTVGNTTVAQLSMPWTCDVCTLVNEVNESMCMACEQPRVLAPVENTTNTTTNVENNTVATTTEAAPAPSLPAAIQEELAATFQSFSHLLNESGEGGFFAQPSMYMPDMGSFTPPNPFGVVSPGAETTDEDSDEESDESEAATDPETAPKPAKVATKSKPSNGVFDDEEGYDDEYNSYELGGGIGYAGHEGDTKKVKQAAKRRHRRENRVDGNIASLMRSLISVLEAIESNTAEIPIVDALSNILLGVGFGDGLYTKRSEYADDKAVGETTSRKYRVGCGDGIFGHSSLYSAVSSKLRMTMMDIQAGTEQQREFWFALVLLLQRLASCRGGLFAPVLAYSPRRDRNDLPVDSADKAYTPLEKSQLATVLDSEKVIKLSSASISALLPPLKHKAALYAKAAVGISKSSPSDAVGGPSAHDALFIALLSLAQDVQTAAEKVDLAVKLWASASADPASYKIVCEADAAPATEKSPKPAAPPKSSTADAVAGAGELGDEEHGSECDEDAEEDDEMDDDEYGYGAPRRKYQPAIPVEKIEGVLGGVSAVWGPNCMPRDPCAPVSTESSPSSAADGAGAEPLLGAAYRPPEDVATKYVDVLKEEAYNTVENLSDGHALIVGPHADHSTGSGFTDPKRLMRVSAEMANLPDLAVHWGSSILVRTDESSMDIMRAYIVGPPDTPYSNGFFGFDIKLTPAYPDEPPKVEFTTTGGGSVRFNPNLYAEGKVCLSLLGTWQGPGWEKGVSTLSQVLLSIQAQILVEKPYANEPGYERRMNTVAGKRSVMMHNTQLRLATIRHAMLDVLKKLPLGFERAVKTHFWLKRDELRHQMDCWLQEAQACAKYEQILITRWRAAHAAWKAAKEAERLAQAELKSWLSHSSISGHQVFGHTSAGESSLSGAGKLGLPAAGEEPRDEFCLHVADETDKEEAGKEAQRKLWKQLVASAFGGFKASNSHFKPFYAYSGGKKDPFMPRAIEDVWRVVAKKPYMQNVLPPLEGHKARKILADVFTAASFSPPFVDTILVRTETVEVPDYGTDFAVACASLAPQLTVPHSAPQEWPTSAESGPFPIVIDANMLTTKEGINNILEHIVAQLKPFAKRPWKEVAALLSAVPDNAGFVLRNVVSNRSANAGAVAAGAGAVDPDVGDFNPPILTYPIGSRDIVPTCLLSPALALSNLHSQQASMAFGYPDPFGGYPSGYPRAARADASAGDDAAKDEWEESKKAMGSLLDRSKRMVNFRDLARAMELAVGELYAALAEMSDPTEDEYGSEF